MLCITNNTSSETRCLEHLSCFLFILKNVTEKLNWNKVLKQINTRICLQEKTQNKNDFCDSESVFLQIAKFCVNCFKHFMNATVNEPDISKYGL